MAGLLALVAGSAFIVVIFAVAWYIFSAFGLYALAKNNGYEDKAFFAFIPFLNRYLFGILGGDANIFDKLYIASNTFGILLIVVPLLIIIPFIGFIAAIFSSILQVYALLNLYRKIDYDNATLMTVLAILFPIVNPIYLFIKRNTIFDSGYIDV